MAKPPPLPQRARPRRAPPPLPFATKIGGPPRRPPPPPPTAFSTASGGSGGPNLVPPNRPFLRGRVGEINWSAQDKQVAVGDDRLLGAVDQQQFLVKDRIAERLRQTNIELQWVPGPPSSHVHSFALWDARKLMVMKTPKGQYIVDSPADLPPSRIYVRFRPSPAGFHKKKRGGIGQHLARNITQYVYYSAFHQKMKDIYDQMFSSAHPGKVIYDKLVDEVPYQRIY